MVYEKVRKLLAEQLGINESRITEKTRIAEDHGADPLDLIQLIMSVETEFSMDIPNKKIKHIRTVGDVVRIVEETMR